MNVAIAQADVIAIATITEGMTEKNLLRRDRDRTIKVDITRTLKGSLPAGPLLVKMPDLAWNYSRPLLAGQDCILFLRHTRSDSSEYIAMFDGTTLHTAEAESSLSEAIKLTPAWSPPRTDGPR